MISTSDLQKFIHLLNQELSILKKVQKVCIIPYFKVKISQKIWKINSEIEQKKEYIINYVEHSKH